MGSSSKGGSSQPQYTSADAFNHGYGLKEGSVRMDGMAGWDPSMEGYDQVYAGYMKAHNEKVQGELFKNMMAGQAADQSSYMAAMNAQNRQSGNEFLALLAQEIT